MKFTLVIHFNEFLAASSQEGAIQLHFGTAVHEEAPQKRAALHFFMYSLYYIAV
jgi:heme O synthase-like polyprenyltransferase